MVIRFDGSRMVAVFPESSLPLLPLIERLGGTAGNQLHRSGYYLALSAVKHKQMDMVGCGCIVQNAQPVAFSRFKKPTRP
jgi:hypothetical protein